MGNNFSLAAEVGREYPETQIKLIVARGVRNDEAWPEVEDRIQHLEHAIAENSWTPFEETTPVIASWHEAYRRFGTNPRRSRPSLDALSRRLKRNGQMPRINPAVDAYNLVSVTHGAPAGAFDLLKITGQVCVRFAKPGDTFVPLGEPDIVEVPSPGEVIYAQGDEVLTRHWNHRDSESTKVTTSSTDVVFIVERVSAAALSSPQMSAAQADLAKLIESHADDVILASIDPENPVADLT
jgi:DNA/RNA-binding domain of Phe-tRNA-synthetase-like protein